MFSSDTKEDYSEDFKERTVSRFVKVLREQLGIPKSSPPREYTAVAELPPGKQMQVDFGEMYMPNAGGTGKTKVRFAVFVLSHSRYKFAYFQSIPFHTVDLVTAMTECFRYFDGIVNATSVFETGRISEESPEKYFSEIGISGKWFDNMELFPEKKDVYALISEICGEYINDVNNENFYTYTFLDKFLDICRKLDGEYSIENIFIAKSVIHNNLICGVDFSFLNLPLIISSDIRFSLNGKYPCDFSDTCVYCVDVSDDTQADNFKNCNFSGARFLDAEVKETLHKMGAIVDFEDDNFMDSLYRDILLPWIDF